MVLLLLTIVTNPKVSLILSVKKWLWERIFTFKGSMIVKRPLLYEPTNPQYLHINIHQRFLVPLCSFCAPSEYCKATTCTFFSLFKQMVLKLNKMCITIVFPPYISYWLTGNIQFKFV